MTDGLNLFDERAAECVNQCLQEEKCTSSSSWEDSKMYAPGTIANEGCHLKQKTMVLIAKVRILVEQVILYIRHLKKLRIISNKMPVLIHSMSREIMIYEQCNFHLQSFLEVMDQKYF